MKGDTTCNGNAHRRRVTASDSLVVLVDARGGFCLHSEIGTYADVLASGRREPANAAAATAGGSGEGSLKHQLKSPTNSVGDVLGDKVSVKSDMHASKSCVVALLPSLYTNTKRPTSATFSAIYSPQSSLSFSTPNSGKERRTNRNMPRIALPLPDDGNAGSEKQK